MSKKLIDILSVSKEASEKEAVSTRVAQANINTQQEILNIKGQLNRQEDVIANTLKANPFSASALYAARKEKALIELKLKGVQDILEELF